MENRDFASSSVLFDGDCPLLCDVDSVDFPVGPWEYFPIRCDFMSQETLGNFEYVTIARKDGSSDLDRKLQWLFETPSLTLTEGVEEFGQGVGANRKSYTFSFYNGLLISDPQGRGSLRLTASDMPDFVVTGEFTFGPEP